MDGLRKGRKIYVRKPEPDEKNANILLIQKGAIAVDYNGIENAKSVYTEQSTTTSIVQEPMQNTKSF